MAQPTNKPRFLLRITLTFALFLALFWVSGFFPAVNPSIRSIAALFVASVFTTAILYLADRWRDA
jgi:hypothetical protein